VILGSESHGAHDHILLSDGSGLQTTASAVHILKTDRSTDSPLIRHGPYRKRRVHKVFYCYVCIRCSGNVFTELSPSNDRRDTHTDTQTDGRAAAAAAAAAAGPDPVENNSSFDCCVQAEVSPHRKRWSLPLLRCLATVINNVSTVDC
jgi:hypothetical protein